MRDLETALHIFALSDHHRGFTVAQLERVLFPALELRQYRIYSDDSIPAAFVSWGFLSDEASHKLKKQGESRFLMPEDWVSGYNVWIMDLICPYGGIKALGKIRSNLEDLRSRHNRGEFVAGGEHLAGLVFDKFTWRRAKGPFIKVKETIYSGEYLESRGKYKNALEA